MHIYFRGNYSVRVIGIVLNADLPYVLTCCDGDFAIHFDLMWPWNLSQGHTVNMYCILEQTRWLEMSNIALNVDLSSIWSCYDLEIWSVNLNFDSSLWWRYRDKYHAVAMVRSFAKWRLAMHLTVFWPWPANLTDILYCCELGLGVKGHVASMSRISEQTIWLEKS